MPLPLPPALLIWSGKGGVGKSTIAAVLTRALHREGLRVGYFDADLTGPSAPLVFGIDNRLRVENHRIQPAIRDGIPIVSTGLLAEADHAYIWHGPLLRGALHQLLHDTHWGPLDLLVIDMPPGTGEAQIAVIDECAPATAIIVTTPHDLSLADTRRSLRMLTDANIPVLAIVENMTTATCPNCHHTWPPFAGAAGAALSRAVPGVPHIRLPLEAFPARHLSDSRGTPHTDPSDSTFLNHLTELARALTRDRRLIPTTTVGRPRQPS